ncbi:MAG TPA: hypothetical protein VGF94_15810 [Kofleriaceae bacterium]|jgi:hypothetical protein
MSKSETPVQHDHDTVRERGPRERRPSQLPAIDDADRISLMSWDSPLVRE